MQGGADKVIEAGGTLAGGHSIADSDVKYGLSVMGTVHPKHIYSNNTGLVRRAYTDQEARSWACVQRKPCRGSSVRCN